MVRATRRSARAWNGCGGNVTDTRRWLNVEKAARDAGDQAIFVYAQIGTSPDPAAGEGCFDGDGDQLYFLQVLADVEAAFCIDQNEVFTTGVFERRHPVAAPGAGQLEQCG